MSHSKRNTSLAFFTAHERNQLKSHWGSQSTRLSRDSFLPFASCALCLQPSRSPVACTSHGDIFCRECVVSNLLAQRGAIKRAEKDEERRKRENEVKASEKAEEERERSIRDFERTMMGLEGMSKGKADSGTGTELGTGKDGGGRGTKRKFSLDAAEVARNEQDERVKARKAIDDEKASLPTLPAFWVPSLTPSTNPSTQTSSPRNAHPLCPSSSPTPHPLSLKTLVTINFSSSTATTSSSSSTAGAASQDSTTHICPACTKPLSNASKAVLAIQCGHVVCKPCAGKFMAAEKRDPHACADNEGEGEGGRVRCYVCSTDLGSGLGQGKEKKKGKDKGPGRGMVELRSEGTGFAGGGKNIASRSGVAFQC